MELTSALIIWEPQGGDTRSSLNYFFANAATSLLVRTVLGPTSLHQNNENSCAYVGNNFSWPCNSPDFCHNSHMLFCNCVHFFTKAMHFLTKAIAVVLYSVAISWSYVRAQQYSPGCIPVPGTKHTVNTIPQSTFRHMQNIIFCFLYVFRLSVTCRNLLTAITIQ